jgi:hypothetical protein
MAVNVRAASRVDEHARRSPVTLLADGWPLADEVSFIDVVDG